MLKHLSTAEKDKLTLPLACVTICLWVALAASLNESQLGDSLEQFIWAQSFEWGYWKHPPMSTWLLYGVLHVFGPSDLWTYVLSAVLYTVTLVATYKITALLFDADRAAWIALLLTLHYGFTRRAQLYNHNSVLVTFIAVTALLTLLALRDQKLWQWIATGAFAAFSILVKYQAIFPLLGIFVAIALADQFKKSKRGLLIASVIGLAILLPHIQWIFQSRFQTITYALNYVENSGFNARGERQISFMLTQVRYYLPMMFFLALLWAFDYASKKKQIHKKLPLSANQRAWIIGLVVIPLGLVLFTAMALGVKLQSHWGLQTTQFLSLCIAYWIYNKYGAISRAAIYTWLGVQVVAISIFVGQGIGLILYANSALAVRELPAKPMTAEALNFWKSQTQCPLKYISGVSSMSALLVAHAGTPIQALEDGDYKKSPWIHPDDLEKNGFLEVAISDVASSEPQSHSIKYSLTSHDAVNQATDKFLVLKYHAPTIGNCSR